MKDLFSSYHKQKALSHLGILAISWVLAVSVNMFVLWGSNWDALKANIKEIQSSDVQSEDISILHQENNLVIENNQKMDSVVQLSFSLAYNQDLLMFWDAISTIDGADISKIETTPWFSSFIVVFTSPVDLDKGSEIIKLAFTRSNDETIHLNPVNINFIDSQENNYSLTASSLIF